MLALFKKKKKLVLTKVLSIFFVCFQLLNSFSKYLYCGLVIVTLAALDQTNMA